MMREPPTMDDVPIVSGLGLAYWRAPIIRAMIFEQLVVEFDHTFLKMCGILPSVTPDAGCPRTTNP